MEARCTPWSEVQRIAREFAPRFHQEADREDAMQEGAIGLLEASARYDPSRGSALETYGAHRIRGAMWDHLRRVSRRSREVASSVDESREEPAEFRREESHSPESRVMLLRFRKFLSDLADRLSGEEARLLDLRFRQGLSLREASQVLGQSPQSVMRREQRLLARLREEFLDSRRGHGAPGR
ncbi:MAG TPA: sigma-70 family RNA polymerase sigma factor [Myxococcota bacterium]|nr:sigma-70 family RNA polymerase sigma factor [Myxococcota bacterium]HQK51040.1 sigma-70 family RNA polymerase sigma factor [Myxococcota bacterium]